jgi:hypothetical protein
MDYPADATFFVRLSLMAPRPGMQERLLELDRQLLEWLQQQPGFVRGFLIVDGDPDGRVGHITVYDSAFNADQVAQTQHVLSVRSELKLLAQEDTQIELSWTGVDPMLARQATP